MTAFIIFFAAVICLAALYLWLTAPSLKKRDLDFLNGTLIAHRGIHDDPAVAENSLEAFRLAMEKGLPIELDVHLTRDFVPVVVHDGNLFRVCGIDKRVREMSLEEIKKHPLLANGETVPTLKEVLDAVSGRVPLLIELKGSDRGRVAERSWEVLTDYDGDFAVQSFNPYYIHRFRKVAPHVPVGILSERRNRRGKKFSFSGCLSENLMFNFAYRPDFISYKYSDKLPLSAKLCSRLGIPVYAWTVRDKGAYEKYKSSFDALICENIADYE